MADENTGTANANGNGGGAGTAQGSQDDRTKWTTDQWQDFTQRESDRRVTDAQKKWREDLAAQLTAKDKDAEQKISTVLEQAKQAEARAAFVELAHASGIADVKAAWAVVKEYGLSDSKGNVDFGKLKDAHPSLFVGQSKPSVVHRQDDAGNGEKLNMTKILRLAAQRNTVVTG
jgi:hypothetical protein